MKNKTIYRVEQPTSFCRDFTIEREAIECAEFLRAERGYEWVTVTMIVESGTYNSRTQVWPTVGATYSN